LKLKFLGAAGTVTGSSYVLTPNEGQPIMVDLGMFQGFKEGKDIGALNSQPLKVDARNLAGMVLTHAHLDHVGRLPLLMKMGYQGRFFMTAPTAELAEIVLLDSAKIAESDEDKPVIYTKGHVEATLNRIEIIDYHQPFRVGQFEITAFDAGHIIGSTSLVVIDKLQKGKQTKVVFSGDIGNFPQPIEKPTEMIPEGDVVLLESTYGGRYHTKEKPEDILAKEVNLVEKTRAALLIPSFSIERTQVLLLIIKRLKKQNRIKPQTPVFLDSPMATAATVVYKHYPHLYNQPLAQASKKDDPLDFPGLVVVGSGRQSSQIRKQRGAKVIIAGSGMMEGGRIVSHAAHLLPRPETRLLFVGYQAEKTMGRTILEGAKNIVIDKRNTTVRATINQIENLSAHADENQLLTWLGAIKGVRKLFLIHAEPEAREILAAKIEEKLKINDIVLPTLNQEVSFS
jgi:metallo-beta-lactamase family protein